MSRGILASLAIATLLYVAVAVVLSGMVRGAPVAVTASVFPIDKLEEMVNIGTLFAFVLVSASVMCRCRRRPITTWPTTWPG